jgi:hypothetical protein
LIVNHSILIPTLNPNLISTMKFILHDVIVNGRTKFQSLNLTNISHCIILRGEDVDDMLVTPLEVNGVVSCFPTFKPTHQEFETCDRFESMYESPEYYPSARTFHDQEAGMMD